MSINPSELTCPISKDLMNDPVIVTHEGCDYAFDRICLETWKTTPGGDQNPLTMLYGFRDAPCKPSLEIKDSVRQYRLSNGLETDVDTEKVTLEPFSDYQQIQDDEAEALRLDMELNGPPEGVSTSLYIRTTDSSGGYHDGIIDMHPGLSMLIHSSDIPLSIRRDMMNSWIDLVLELVPRSVEEFQEGYPDITLPEL